MAALEGDLLILGVAGKMGPTLAHRAGAPARPPACSKRIIGVARFSDPGRASGSSRAGASRPSPPTCSTPGALASLPDAPNVIFMAGAKFGSTGDESLTWAMNAYLPGLVAERYRDSRIVAFSTGNVYPLHAGRTAARRDDAAAARSASTRSPAWAASACSSTSPRSTARRRALIRLNYAIDLRYGVLLDIAPQGLSSAARST